MCPAHLRVGGRGGTESGLRMRRGPVQPGEPGGSPRVVVKGPPAPSTSAPLEQRFQTQAHSQALGGQEFSRTVLHQGDLLPVPAFVPTVRTFQVQNIRERLSVNNHLGQGKTKDSTAHGTKNVLGPRRRRGQELACAPSHDGE